jgi:hypothetical protein
MSKKFYLSLLLFFLIGNTKAQPCVNFSATAEAIESRCAATGKIIIKAVNGSGNYNYAVNGPVSTPYTNSDTINGLPPGSYQVFVKDVINDCFFSIASVLVPGSYQDPRFELQKTDVYCFNGANGTITVSNVQFGRAPFNYTIVAPSAYGIGTSDSNGVFTNLVPGNYFIQQSDSCGGIQTRNISILNYDWFIESTPVQLVSCDSADISILLKDIYGNVNTSGSVFDGYTYGYVTPNGDSAELNTYQFRIHLGTFRWLTLFAKDKCGNIKSVIWMNNKIPLVANLVTQLNQNCSTFSALITGQQNLNNPEYCLFDSLNNLISCNSTGQFDSLAYGSYCIRITDQCYDTVINRCFTAVKPIPSVDANVTVTYGDDCNSYWVSVTGQTNLFNPVFCLYDSADVLIKCNTTGIFDSVAVGRYCIKITGSICNDTTLIRCFTVLPEILGGSTGTEFSNFNCSTFTGKIIGTTRLGNATYCLYDSKNILLYCNNTGVFDSLAYGNYCITIQTSTLAGACSDTIFTRCFTVSKPAPELGDIKIKKNCNSFSAELESYQHIFNPEFCLYKDGVLLLCSKTPVFTNLDFGSYCLQVKDSCTDSTLIKCFDAEPELLILKASAKPSCTLGESKITVNIQRGIAPYELKLYNPADSLIKTINTTKKQTTFDNLPPLPAGEEYKVVITDSCKNSFTVTAEPVISYFTKIITQSRNCPGGSYTQGSSDVIVNLVSNIGKVIPEIIEKDGLSVSVPYTFSNTAQTSFTFKNMEPGTYILKSRINNSCNITVFDTVKVTFYQYPSLQNSVLYRCDDNSFNITAVTTAGLGPNMYEIIGSFPAFPSIVTAPQSNPQFKIDNGSAYSLVRLRVVDACGNASINDISLVPSVNLFITSDGGCMNKEVTLSVDTIANASYRWYKKITATDSLLVDSLPNHYISTVTPADTGLYVCYVNINNGCISRVSSYRLTGFCDSVLSDASFILYTRKKNTKVLLEWKMKNQTGVKEFIAERRKGNNTAYLQIAKQTPRFDHFWYKTTDSTDTNVKYFYRIKAIKEDGTILYSNIAVAEGNNTEAGITAYPNPAASFVMLKLNNKLPGEYQIRIMDLNGRIVAEQTIAAAVQELVKIKRPNQIISGTYLLSIVNKREGLTKMVKIVFR